MPAKWSFSPRWNHSGTALNSWITWLPAARPNGWTTPSGLSPAPSKSWTTLAVIPTGWLFPIIVDIAEGKVTFRYKDYRHEAQQKTMILAAEEFIRRFLLHVLPDGFQRIRYYGFLGNRYRQEKLERCRQLLGMASADQTTLATEPKDYRDRYE